MVQASRAICCLTVLSLSGCFTLLPPASIGSEDVCLLFPGDEVLSVHRPQAIEDRFVIRIRGSRVACLDSDGQVLGETEAAGISSALSPRGDRLLTTGAPMKLFDLPHFQERAEQKSLGLDGMLGNVSSCGPARWVVVGATSGDDWSLTVISGSTLVPLSTHERDEYDSRLAGGQVCPVFDAVSKKGVLVAADSVQIMDDNGFPGAFISVTSGRIVGHAIAHGLLAVMDNSGEVTCIDATTGRVCWRRDLGWTDLRCGALAYSVSGEFLALACSRQVPDGGYDCLLEVWSASLRGADVVRSTHLAVDHVVNDVEISESKRRVFAALGPAGLAAWQW